MNNTIFYVLIGLFVIVLISLFRKDSTSTDVVRSVIIEGLESKRIKNEESPAPIANRSDMIKGATEEHNLNTDDHRSHYENIIIDLDHNIGSAMLKHMGEHSVSISKDPMSAESQKKMQALTTMGNFRDTLNSNMVWLDKQK